MKQVAGGDDIKTSDENEDEDQEMEPDADHSEPDAQGVCHPPFLLY